jgi:cytochrome c oxidase subunit II
MWPRGVRRSTIAALFAALAFFLTACVVKGPQSALDPQGPIARKEHDLFVPVFWIAVAVFVVVEGLLLVAVIKFRQRRGQEHEAPVQTHGNTRLEVAWTIAPAVLLAGISIPVLFTIFDVAKEPPAALQVKVIGHQWWWEFDYPKQPGISQPIVTANEMHIPTGRAVRLRMTTPPDGVIHSFWIPKLAGKQDVIPGQENLLTIEADRPGTYLGQCAEYCGVSHANMRHRVLAQRPVDFAAWVRAQQAPAAASFSDNRVVEQLWSTVCIQCHQLQPGAATFGPNLAHFASRATFGGSIYTGFASGLTDEARADLFAWLVDPQSAKPGNDMVLTDSATHRRLRLTRVQVEALIAFLERLR